MTAPLIAASVWIYGASASAFRYQHDVRVAQNARSALVRVFLAAESDVRGFAATGNPYFADAYRVRARAFGASAERLVSALPPLHVASGAAVVADERAAFGSWNRTVAEPIAGGARTRAGRLLRYADPRLARRVLDDDGRIGRLLDDAASRSAVIRQELLRRLLVASVVVVGAVAMLAGFLERLRAAAERREFEQAILYEEERRVSKLLQSAFVPERLSDVDGVALHAVYVPAARERAIGGDWYEVVPLRDRRMLLVVGDVAGHGLVAAVEMNRVRRAILEAAVIESDPARMLARANRSIAAAPGGTLVTAACCVFDADALDLAYATAGHPPPIVVPPAGDAYALGNGGPPLGVDGGIELTTSHHAFGPDAMLVLYTDGLTEEQRDVVASERTLIAAATAHRRARDPAAAIFAALVPSRHPRDDVAVLTMRVDGVPLERSAVPHHPAVDEEGRSGGIRCGV